MSRSSTPAKAAKKVRSIHDSVINRAPIGSIRRLNLHGLLDFTPVLKAS